jgi:hypothetical protein
MANNLVVVIAVGVSALQHLDIFRVGASLALGERSADAAAQHQEHRAD